MGGATGAAKVHFDLTLFRLRLGSVTVANLCLLETAVSGGRLQSADNDCVWTCVSGRVNVGARARNAVGYAELCGPDLWLLETELSLEKEQMCKYYLNATSATVTVSVWIL